MKAIGHLIIFSFWVCLLISCSEEKKGSEGDFTGSLSIPDSLLPQGDETYLYTLPAPLQMSSMLKAYNVPFNSEIKLVNPIRIKNHSTTFEKSINLGFYIIDMGYLIMYDRNAEGAKYIKAIEMLMDEIGISNSIRDHLAIRFKNNINHKDSLSHIILESYQQSHSYFQQNGREGIGILLLTGCYIEGLYIATKCNIRDQRLLSKMLGQNKIFLNNIIELLKYYITNKEVGGLINDLKDLRDVFEKIEVGSGEEPNPDIDDLIDHETIKLISDSANALRNKYVN